MTTTRSGIPGPGAPDDATKPRTPPRVVSSAAALMIGEELLSGKIDDANLHPLAATLRARGIRLRRVVVVPDSTEIIKREVASMVAEHDVVFTSGGIGPTHDDVTVEAVAAALGVPVVVDEVLAAMIDDVYGHEAGDAHRLMARVPQGASLISTQEVRWPTVVADKIWLLPGVPEIFRMRLSVVRECLRGPAPLFAAAVFTTVEEVTLKPLLDKLVKQYPNVEIGSYPRWFDKRYKTKITFDSPNEAAVHTAAEDLRHQLGPDKLAQLDLD